MSDARVTNVASIDDFRVALAEFAVQVRQAITDLEMETHRAMDWISVDRPAHWKGEVRRSSDLVARAKDELAHSRTFKRMGDFVPSCIEEKKRSIRQSIGWHMRSRKSKRCDIGHPLRDGQWTNSGARYS